MLQINKNDSFISTSQNLLESALKKTGAKDLFLTFNEPCSSGWKKFGDRSDQYERCASFFVCKPRFLLPAQKALVLNIKERRDNGDISVEIRESKRTPFMRIFHLHPHIHEKGQEHRLVWSYNIAKRINGSREEANAPKLKEFMIQLRHILIPKSEATLPKNSRERSPSRYTVHLQH